MQNTIDDLLDMSFTLTDFVMLRSHIMHEVTEPSSSSKLVSFTISAFSKGCESTLRLLDIVSIYLSGDSGCLLLFEFNIN